MNKELTAFFDRFFTIALKDHIKDPLVQAEWAYFQSMMANSTLDKERINMYLSVL